MPARTKSARFWILLLVAVPCFAQQPQDSRPQPQPKSGKARTAIKEYERAVEVARKEYARAIAAARKQCKEELQQALKAALKAESLDEAKSIEAAIAKLDEEPAARPELDTKKLLLGTWAVTVGKTSMEWTFRDDGSVAATGGGASKGSWTLEKGRVLIKWDENMWESLNLPLNPSGTSGASWHGASWPVNARKLATAR